MMATKCWGKPQKHTVKWHKFKTFFVQFHKNQWFDENVYQRKYCKYEVS